MREEGGREGETEGGGKKKEGEERRGERKRNEGSMRSWKTCTLRINRP